MKKIQSLFVLIFFSLSAFAQEIDVDIAQLKTEIEQATSDSIRIPLLLKLSDLVGRSDINEACQLVLDAQKIIDDNGYENLHFQKQKVEIFQSLSVCASVKGNLAEALKHQLEALNLSVKINDTIGIGNAYAGTGVIYQKKNDTINADRYYRRALKIQEKKSEPYDLAFTYMKLGHICSKYRKMDSARYFFRRAKEANPTINGLINANSNIGTTYIYEEAYEKAIDVLKENLELVDPKNYYVLSSIYYNLASSYKPLNDYDKALEYIDSAIVYSKKTNQKIRLRDQYEDKHSISARAGLYKEAYEAHQLFKVFSDSLNDTNEIKRFTELELNYEFDKEREIAAIQLTNATSKKRLYFMLFFGVLSLGLLAIYFILKSKKQKIKLAHNQIELGQMDKLKAELSLANRENELKKVLVESSITEEVLNKTLDDIKEIITAENETDRQLGLRSLSASLLSEKSTQKASSTLQEYLDQVSIDFKIHLDTNFPELRSKDKELLYLMKAGLSTSEISKLLRTSVASVKSMRYRMRKKLSLDSNADIVSYLEKKR